MTLQGGRWTTILRTLQILFYAAFIVLWFKGNFPPLKHLPVPAAVPLAGLVLATIPRIVSRLKGRPLRIKFTRDVWIVGLILVLFLGVRVPFLIAHDGLMDSDEAIPALQGKHIAEGKLPAVFYYGALFQGSLPQHYYALLFRIFGYSVFLVKLSALLAFAAFLAVQYGLLLKLYGREFAVLASLFYLFPFRHLIRSNFDIGSGFPVVFLLGVLIFGLTRAVAEDREDRRLPVLGFIMGLAFWTHQIAFVFLLTAAVYLVLTYRLRIKPYAVLALYFALGALPLLISEVYWKFPIYRSLLKGGSSWTLGPDKFVNGAKLARELVSPGPVWANALFFLAAGAGLIVILIRSGRARKRPAAGLYAIYVLSFGLVYFLSGLSSERIVRYLYVLYIALPVLLIAPLIRIRPRLLRRGAVALLFVGLFFVNGREAAVARYRYVKHLDSEIHQVVAAMEATGERYWASDYWVSYLLAAVSREKLIMASTTVERYPVYRLVYDTEATRTNRVFWEGYDDPAPNQKKEAEDFLALLARAGKKYQTVKSGTWLLVHGIEGYVYQQNLFYPPPEIPEVVFSGAEAAGAEIALRFTAKRPLGGGDFQLHAEVADVCSRSTPIGPGSEFIVRIPFPPRRSVRLRYYVCHLGLLLDPTVRETEVFFPEPPPPAALDPVEFLAGVGPRESVTGNGWPVLERVVSIRLNRVPAKSGLMTLGLYSPYYFNDPWWYGDFAQTAEVIVNGVSCRTLRLADGRNTFRLDLRARPFTDGPNIITLKFAYAFVLSAKNYWKTAAFLQDLSVE
jgi:4-amino-4-deoxy-L-arabinose transferase-like glycosyltransferase